MISGILALLAILKPILVPLGAFLAGLLFPSPIQKAISGTTEVHKNEEDAKNNSVNLDSLP
jgi:hypothetical protein